MKKIILFGTIIFLFSLMAFFPGCGCGQNEQPQEEKPVNVLDPDFKGPDSLPFSQGPGTPPPTN
ncbi:hypothetical protein JW911_01065 [Candidatus Peregrinibacteria bacterium]|nr:hypothetical protein [Candidatus Peregrinibacteria bacterium]